MYQINVLILCEILEQSISNSDSQCDMQLGPTTILCPGIVRGEPSSPRSTPSAAYRSANLIRCSTPLVVRGKPICSDLCNNNTIFLFSLKVWLELLY